MCGRHCVAGYSHHGDEPAIVIVCLDFRRPHFDGDLHHALDLGIGDDLLAPVPTAPRVVDLPGGGGRGGQLLLHLQPRVGNLIERDPLGECLVAQI